MMSGGAKTETIEACDAGYRTAMLTKKNEIILGFHPRGQSEERTVLFSIPLDDARILAAHLHRLIKLADSGQATGGMA